MNSLSLTINYRNNHQVYDYSTDDIAAYADPIALLIKRVIAQRDCKLDGHIEADEWHDCLRCRDKVKA